MPKLITELLAPASPETRFREPLTRRLAAVQWSTVNSSSLLWFLLLFRFLFIFCCVNSFSRLKVWSTADNSSQFICRHLASLRWFLLSHFLDSVLVIKTRLLDATEWLILKSQLSLHFANYNSLWKCILNEEAIFLDKRINRCFRKCC